MDIVLTIKPEAQGPIELNCLLIFCKDTQVNFLFSILSPEVGQQSLHSQPAIPLPLIAPVNQQAVQP